jgi:hypothetical protein
MSGYININLNGQIVGLKFGYQSVKWFTLDSEQFQDEYFEKDEKGEPASMTTLGFADLLHCAYRNNQLLKKEREHIGLDEFYDWVVEQSQSEQGQKLLMEVDRVCTESKEVQLFKKRVEEATEDLKKKIQLNGSNPLNQPSLQME